MAINRRNILSSIASAGFHDDYNNWHIAKHDVYGQQFNERWVDTGDVEHTIGQEDDVDDIIDDGSIDS
jgi:hypothetical protein